MAEHSGFFTARIVDQVPDRRYTAEDYSDNLAVVISSGVLRTAADDLKVTASGMICTVGVGRGWIKGHYYKNDAALELSAAEAPVGGARWDRVVLRLDTGLAQRSIRVVYIQGEASNDPVKPAPVRSGNVYDLVLADVYVAAGASSVVVTDTRADAEICGWVYSTSGDGSFFVSLDNEFEEWFSGVRDELASVTLFKRYTDEITLEAETDEVTFSISQYDPDTCMIEVFVNGILEEDYTLDGSTITFGGDLIAGTVVTVRVYKSLDGEGIMSVADEITELQNQMQEVIHSAKFTYTCTGTDDNASLSDIAQAILDGSYTAESVTAAADAFLQALGSGFLAGLAADAQVTIEVSGEISATSADSGSGTSADPYHFFNFGKASATGRKVVFDFAKCQKISCSVAASTYNEVFYGTDVHVKNANLAVVSSAAGVAVKVFGTGTGAGSITAEACKFSVDVTGDVSISDNGDFGGCNAAISSSGGNALCFPCASVGLVRAHGGRYTAHAVTSGGETSAVFYTSSADTSAVILAEGVSAPSVTKSGYTQVNLASGNAGQIVLQNAISVLTNAGSYVTATGTIAKSK